MKYIRTNYFHSHSKSIGSQSLDIAHISGDSYCIAIVEVVKDDSIKVIDFGSRSHLTHFISSNQQTNTTSTKPNFDNNSTATKYYVVDKDKLIQLRNLLVFKGSYS